MSADQASSTAVRAPEPEAAPAPPSASRREREARFKPLTADYWGPNVRHPYWKAAAGVLGAPIVMAAALGLFAWGLAFAEKVTKPAPGPSPAAYGIDTFEMMLLVGFGPVFWPAGAAFLVLWSLRARGPESFFAAGVVSGPIGAVFHGIQSDFNVSLLHMPMVIAVTILHVVVLQIMRVFSGVGRQRRVRT